MWPLGSRRLLLRTRGVLCSILSLHSGNRACLGPSGKMAYAALAIILSRRGLWGDALSSCDRLRSRVHTLWGGLHAHFPLESLERPGTGEAGRSVTTSGQADLRPLQSATRKMLRDYDRDRYEARGSVDERPLCLQCVATWTWSVGAWLSPPPPPKSRAFSR